MLVKKKLPMYDTVSKGDECRGVARISETGGEKKKYTSFR